MTVMHSTRIYNEWVSLQSECFVTTNLHQDLWIFSAKHDSLHVDSQKVQEHTWTSNPKVGRLITPLWSGTSEKATKSTACHLSKGTVTTFIWQRYALCCGGKLFSFHNARENNNRLFVFFMTIRIILLYGRF